MAHFTIGRILLLIAALGFTLAALQGNHLWFSGLTLLTILGLLISAIGAGPDVGRSGTIAPHR